MLTVILVLYNLHVMFLKNPSNSKTKKPNPKKLKTAPNQVDLLEAAGDYIRKKSKK